LQPCCGLFDSGATTVSQAYKLDFRGQACLVDIRDHMMSNAGVCFPPCYCCYIGTLLLVIYIVIVRVWRQWRIYTEGNVLLALVCVCCSKRRP